MSVGGSGRAEPAADAQHLHVDPVGTGEACTEAEPCGLDTARARVRGLVPTMASDIVVELAGGTYHLTQPFALGPQDQAIIDAAGTPSAPR